MAEIAVPEVPHIDETSVEVDETILADETETDKESKEATNGVKKENVPPKRPGVTAARRPGASTTSSATKPTASSAASTRTTGGLSKPPTRPAAGSVVRKPASSATAPTSSRFVDLFCPDF